MKQKEFKKFSPIKNPYYIFTNEENILPSQNIHLKTENLLKYRIRNNKKIRIHPLKDYNSITSKVSSIPRSLKKAVLNSKIYGSYINFYSNLTQENYFKKPNIDKYPLLKNKQFLPIKFQNLTERIKNDSKENLSLSKSNSIFLSYLKSLKTQKKNEQKQIYELNFLKNKCFNDKKEDEEGDSENDWKDFSILCFENLFQSKFMNQNKIKKIDINNC